MSLLSDLLTELMSVTRPPRGFDATQVQAMTLRFMRIMRDYDEAVAVKALDDWPKTHEFFPTEPELRAALDKAHKALRPDKKLPAYDDGMSDKPIGASRDFLDELRAVAPSKAEAYFDDGMARFSNARIGVRAKFVREIVERYAPGLLDRHGVRLVEPHRYINNGDGSFGIEWRWE